MLNNPENTEEIVNELNEVEIKIKNLKTLLKNKEGRFCISAYLKTGGSYTILDC